MMQYRIHNAALLNGPPISIAIIPATTIPKITAELCSKPFKKFVNPLLTKATGGLTTNIIIKPIKIPNKGYNNVGLIPSNDCGKKLKYFSNPTTK